MMSARAGLEDGVVAAPRAKSDKAALDATHAKRGNRHCRLFGE